MYVGCRAGCNRKQSNVGQRGVQSGLLDREDVKIEDAEEERNV